MSMVKKKIIFAFGIALGSVAFLSGCTKNADNTKTPDSGIQDVDTDPENDARYQIYILAKQSGYTGTYEEWLESIKGDSISLRVNSGNIEWKYTQATNWTSLISLQELTGNDGRKVELNSSTTHVMWRYEGDSNWTNLFEIPAGNAGLSAYEVAKEAGFTGSETDWLNSLKGSSVELRVYNGNIEWKQSSDSSWEHLYTLAELAGADGREIELNTTTTHIVWRYVDDTEWNNLLEIPTVSDGKSAYEVAKETGFVGTPEEWLESLKGDSVSLRVNDGNIEWKNESDTTWQTLIAVSELAGDDGDDGREVELSTNATHILWRYAGDTEWTNLLEIPTVSNGLSAYEVAKELGFDGTPEQWLESLKGDSVDLRVNNGNIEWKHTSDTEWTVLISLDTLKGDSGREIELSTTETHIVWRYVGDTDWIELVALANISGSSGTTPDVPEELKGLMFTEILGYGYALTGVYLPGEYVYVPEEYNGKPVLCINSMALASKDIKNIVIPETIKSINYYGIMAPSIEAIYFGGTFDEWKDLAIDGTVVTEEYYSLYLYDENGSITVGGKKYTECTEDVISYSGSGTYYGARHVVRTLTIDPSVLNASYVDLTSYPYVDEIFFDGTLEEYLQIQFTNKMVANYVYVLDENGYVDYNGKTYSLVSDIVLPSSFASNIYYYFSNTDIDSVTISNYSQLYNDNVNLVEFLTSAYCDFYFDDDKIELDEYVSDNKNAYINGVELYGYFTSKAYVLDDEGTIIHNGKKYTDYVYTEYVDPVGPTNSSEVVWKPMSLDEASTSYKASGQVDTWIVCSNNYGPTYHGNTYANPFDGKTYTEGDLLPTWSTFASQLGLSNITNGGVYGNNDNSNYQLFSAQRVSDGLYYDNKGDVTDLLYNTTSNLKQLGAQGELVDLIPYITSGKMPAFYKFIFENPAIINDIQVDGHLYYTPYLDGYQAVERGFIMDTAQVAKLLDNTLPAGTGNLLVGEGGDAKGFNTKTSVIPFINNTTNYPDSLTSIDIVNPKTFEKVTVNVHQTQNIIAAQNELIANGCTGADLINQFKDYAMQAYGDIINDYYDGSFAQMFTSVGACYNADDLVALLRIFKANPDVLYGSATLYDEVVPVFTRGQAANRKQNLLQFAATLYGVQGFDSEYDNLFFGADGKLHDAQTQLASYEMVALLNLMYEEGLIQNDFYAGTNGTVGYNRYFAKTVAEQSTYGLLEYDFIATQSMANDYSNGQGTNPSNRRTSPSGYDFSTESFTGIRTVLSPLTYVPTESISVSQSILSSEGKTLQRYYEANRASKTNTSWAIPAGSDNIDSAIALMDLMFTKEGNDVMNFGPEYLWDYGTVLGQNNTPILKQEFFDELGESHTDLWNYMRKYFGSTLGVGHYRPIQLDYQATNDYGKIGYENVVTATRLGVQQNARCIMSSDEISWHSSMVCGLFTPVSADVQSQYSKLSAYWTTTSSTEAVGWIATVLNGLNYQGTIGISTTGESYTFAEAVEETDIKNQTYLYTMANSLGSDLIPDEAKS